MIFTILLQFMNMILNRSKIFSFVLIIFIFFKPGYTQQKNILYKKEISTIANIPVPEGYVRIFEKNNSTDTRSHKLPV